MEQVKRPVPTYPSSDLPQDPIIPLPTDNGIEPGVKRRRRMPCEGRACTACYKSKVACDFQRPCRRCVSKNMAHACVSPENKARQRRKKPVTRACLHCALAKVGCEEVRPCSHCIKKNLACIEQPPKRGGAKAVSPEESIEESTPFPLAAFVADDHTPYSIFEGSQGDLDTDRT
jgi:hypothetical protein